MLDFVETVADATGLPVGIKSAVGNLTFWDELVEAMAAGGRGVDFVNIDGGEGGTGAAPLIFADSVAYPFRIGFARSTGASPRPGLTDDVTFIGAGKLGLPGERRRRVRARRRHDQRRPRGDDRRSAASRPRSATPTTARWASRRRTRGYTRGLDAELKSVRAANYVRSLRRDLLKVSEAVGVVHPGLITPWDVDILTGHRSTEALHDVYGYEDDWGAIGPDLRTTIEEIMMAQGESPLPRPTTR